jgi:hypothetical protein
MMHKLGHVITLVLQVGKQQAHVAEVVVKNLKHCSIVPFNRSSKVVVLLQGWVEDSSSRSST